MTIRANASTDVRWPTEPTANRQRSVPQFLTTQRPAPRQDDQSRGSFVRLAGIVCVAAAITGALVIDWAHVVSALGSAPVDAAVNTASAPAKAPATDKVMVKTIAITPAQPPKAEARDTADLATARAQLARELKQPDSDTAGAAKPKFAAAGGDSLPTSAETGNSGAAPSDRGRPLEPKSSSRALDATESRPLIRRAEELLASGDIAAARLILQRMAEANEHRAALLLASTYDPLVLEKLNVYAFAADVPKARGWYEKAREMGSPEASQRLELLAQLTR